MGTAVTLGDRQTKREREMSEGGAAVNGSDWGGATINRTAEETTTGKMSTVDNPWRPAAP